ncbi:MAG: cytochrome b/b6 domain-containing protein [Caldilineales bacterium]|nr:cytochrome b/b6 domain-containing protein [Caldilineales bacterium]
MSQTKKAYHRFGFVERMEHFFMLLSFTLLAITGLPQKYPDNALSRFVLVGLGGVENTRSVHHISAIVLIALSIFHIFYVAYKVLVLRRRLTMLPSFSDVRDFIQQVAYNLGLSKTRPAMDRYNFGEKIEYWAVVWGTVIMAITGYMLWNPIATTRVLPGEMIPAAKAAHGAEAVLAVLSILTWHFYHVHLKYFNRSMFTGKLSRHEMEEEHMGELQRIQAGQERPLPPPPTLWKRTRLFLPVAGLLAALFLIFTYRFFTVEQTAITTLPPRQVVDAYSPRAKPPLPTATPGAQISGAALPRVLPLEAARIPPQIRSHPLDEARSDCQLCHQPYSMVAPAPLDHLDLENAGCTRCHTLSEEVAKP